MVILSLVTRLYKFHESKDLVLLYYDDDDDDDDDVSDTCEIKIKLQFFGSRTNLDSTVQ